MRGFIVLCLTAVAIAAPQNGYNYNVGSGGAGIGGIVSHGGGSSIGGGGGSFFNQGGSVGHAPQQTVVSKRFFIHTAPEENDDQYQEKHVTVGVPRKNYNVVFIKSAQSSHKKASIKITPAANEEKTVIYVLNKKTDATDIDTQVLEQPSISSKPEVFYIKYKTPEEAQHAQQQIQAQYDALGGSSQVTDEGVVPVSSVIGSVGGGSAGNGAGPVVSGSALLSSPIGGGSIGGGSIGGGHGGSNSYLPPNFK